MKKVKNKKIKSNLNQFKLKEKVKIKVVGGNNPWIEEYPY